MIDIYEFIGNWMTLSFIVAAVFLTLELFGRNRDEAGRFRFPKSLLAVFAIAAAPLILFIGLAIGLAWLVEFALKKVLHFFYFVDQFVAYKTRK